LRASPRRRQRGGLSRDLDLGNAAMRPSSWHLPLRLALATAWSSAAAAAGPDFAREVLPILAEHCLACHGPDVEAREAGLRLDTEASATAALPSGNVAIVPGRPAASELIRRIETDDAAEVMPPPEAGQLPPAARATLQAWIASGATYGVHWAFRSPQRPPIPAVADGDWVRTPIDAFVLARLESLGLRPSPSADRLALLRRASLDLTGLPPTIDELAAFQADAAADAYERAVDRLLASPHCAEKLAQDWLDLARFGDSSGYQDDGDRPNHPYRDAVIAAFDANMPFDQFTIETLAGDLLPNPTVGQRVRSGFHRLHRYNEEGGSDPNEFRVVYAIDRTNTTATTWMGLTLACAQCHDHKYDPFSQREYYQLLAFFNSLKGEVPVGKRSSPPSITVFSAEDEQQLADLDRRIEAVVDEEAALTAPARSDLATRLAQAAEPAADALGEWAPNDALGGAVGRAPRRAWFGDARLAGRLTLEDRLSAAGSLVVASATNSAARLGHFSREGSERDGPSLGLAIAEGPRIFPQAALPDSTALLGPPIDAAYGTTYRWSYVYDPDAGRLTVELRLANRQLVGTSELVLQPAQRVTASVFDAFGLSTEGAEESAPPMLLAIDDLQYVVAAEGPPRTETFAADPGWTGLRHEDDGHDFGLRSARLVRGGVAPPLARLRATPADRREPEQFARLEDLYLLHAVPSLADLRERLEELRRQRSTVASRGAQALVWEEDDSPRPTHLLRRGDFLQPGEAVDRDVPAIFPPLAAEDRRDRLALARWLVSDAHPLTARVAVNRYWKLVFGAGLVRTPEDFGTRGEPPAHPELLDWLAVEFRTARPGQTAWDVKRLLKMLVTSSTYRQTSRVSPAEYQRDPDNRLLGRAARYRLAAEEIRDAALAASGLLCRNVGGRSVYPYQPEHLYRDKEDSVGELRWPTEQGPDLYRRGLYTFIRRTIPYPAFQTFDMSGRGECTVARPRTNTPLQALVTLNNPVFVEAARVVAERVVEQPAAAEGDRLGHLSRRILGRDLEPPEQALLLQLYREQRERFRARPAEAAEFAAQGAAPVRAELDRVEVAAWGTVASALFNSDEAITRE
jgi:hypothetical protein